MVYRNAHNFTDGKFWTWATQSMHCICFVYNSPEATRRGRFAPDDPHALQSVQPLISKWLVQQAMCHSFHIGLGTWEVERNHRARTIIVLSLGYNKRTGKRRMYASRTVSVARSRKSAVSVLTYFLQSLMRWLTNNAPTISTQLFAFLYCLQLFTCNIHITPVDQPNKP